MSRTPLPLHAADFSAFAKSLRAQLAACDRAPSHLELLNMLARSAGFRNFQHLRAGAVPAPEPIPAPRPESVAPSAEDLARAARVARHFDRQGRLVRWPGKQSWRIPCLWALWARMPARETLSEPQVNTLLDAAHTFGDPALLRRWLCDLGLMTRTPDCREYRRIEQTPPPDALALIRRLTHG